MLYLIGLGLWDEKDISLRGLEIVKKCDNVFIEKYTSFWGGNLENLGIKAEEVLREDLENNVDKFLENTKDKNVALLVPGDPLIATTHNSILLEAKKKEIKTEVIHSSSIFSAIGETGLQIYKFGKIATIPFYYSESPYRILEENLKQEAHTLFLLDITKEKLMSCNEGLKILLDSEKKFKKGLISKETEVVVFCKVGSKEQILKYDKIENLLFSVGNTRRSDGAPLLRNEGKRPLFAKQKEGLCELNCFPCVIIVPGKLHFLERDFLASLKS